MHRAESRAARRAGASRGRPASSAWLWMFQMALIFFWITDHSAAQIRTTKLVKRSVRLVANLIKLAGLPLMRPLRKTVLDLI